MPGCNDCSKHNRVLGYNTVTGKHIIQDESGATRQASLVTNSLVHGMSNIIRVNKSFAAAEAQPVKDLERRKYLPEPSDLSLAFVLRLEYNIAVPEINTKVPCNSPYHVAIIDEFDDCSNIGGTCARYCATLEVADPPPSGIGTEYFAGLDSAPCLAYNDPGTVLDFTFNLFHSIAVGPWGQGEISVDVNKDFPSLIPSRYEYELITSGQSRFDYFGQCFFGPTPFGPITRFTNSAGVITGGLPINFCVPQCQSDVSIFPGSWNGAKQFQVQSQNSCLYRNLFFGEWSLVDWDRSLYLAGQDSENFKYSLPLGKFDNTCFFDSTPRTVSFGAFTSAGPIPWTAQTAKPMAIAYWARSGQHQTLGIQTVSLERLPYNYSTSWWDTNFEPETRVVQYVFLFPPTKDPTQWEVLALAELKGIEHDYSLTVEESEIGLVHTDNDTLHAAIKHGYYEPPDLDTGDQLLSSFADMVYADSTFGTLRNLPRDGSVGLLRPTGMYAYEAYILPGDDIPGPDITECQKQLRHTHTVLTSGTASKVEHAGGLTGTALGNELITNPTIKWDLTEGTAVLDGDTQICSVTGETTTPDAIETSGIITALNAFLDDFSPGKSVSDLTEVDVIRLKPINV